MNYDACCWLRLLPIDAMALAFGFPSAAALRASRSWCAIPRYAGRFCSSNEPRPVSGRVCGRSCLPGQLPCRTACAMASSASCLESCRPTHINYINVRNECAHLERCSIFLCSTFTASFRRRVSQHAHVAGGICDKRCPRVSRLAHTLSLRITRQDHKALLRLRYQALSRSRPLLAEQRKAA